MCENRWGTCSVCVAVRPPMRLCGPYRERFHGGAWVGPLLRKQWAGGHRRLIPRGRRFGPGGAHAPRADKCPGLPSRWPPPVPPTALLRRRRQRRRQRCLQCCLHRDRQCDLRRDLRRRRHERPPHTPTTGAPSAPAGCRRVRTVGLGRGPRPAAPRPAAPRPAALLRPSPVPSPLRAPAAPSPSPHRRRAGLRFPAPSAPPRVRPAPPRSPARSAVRTPSFRATKRVCPRLRAAVSTPAPDHHIWLNGIGRTSDACAVPDAEATGICACAPRTRRAHHRRPRGSRAQRILVSFAPLTRLSRATLVAT